MQESRDDPTSPLIRVRVAVLRSAVANPPADPFVFVGGGPAAPTLAWFGEIRFDPQLGDRDIVAFDARGVALSSPALHCPEIRDAVLSSWSTPASIEESRPHLLQATRECRERLPAEGIDPAQYTSAAIADDLEDLRTVLGYPAWNMYGISYGTRIVLEYMRRHPDGIRSALLDGLVPPDALRGSALGTLGPQALENLFAACEADSQCSSSYPGLRGTFLSLIDRLNDQPEVVRFSMGDKSTELAFNGEGLVLGLFLTLHSRGGIVNAPSALAALERGNVRLLRDVASETLWVTGAVTHGALLSIYCADYFSPELLEFPAPDDADEGRIGSVFLADAQNLMEQCSVWGASADPATRQPVSSAVPTLLLSGEYDPVTPPAYGEQVAQALEAATHVILPAIGHGALFSTSYCPHRILGAFLAAPGDPLDLSCVDEMPGLNFR